MIPKKLPFTLALWLVFTMSARRFILAIDQGTTSTRAVIIDSSLRVVGVGQREFAQHFPKSGWVEHDLSEIWTSVEWCIGKALKTAGLKGHQLSAIGITNQRETCGLWRKNGHPLHRAIVWQDRRTAEQCAHLKALGHESLIRQKTGLVLDPYFSGTKIRWLIDNVKGVKPLVEKGEVLAGTIDSWLVYNLSGMRAHVSDVTNASRTLLFNLNTMAWDAALLDLLQVPLSILPKVVDSSQVFATTLGLKSLPDGIPIAGIAGDQQAALFGQACFEVGEAKCTYGTGAFLLMNVGERPVFSKAGLLTTVGWKIGAQTTYALEGSSFVAGAAVQWLRDGLGLIKHASEVEALAKTVKNSGGVVFVPALAGLGAPHWRPEARGLLSGLDRASSKGQVARAVLEGIALQIQDLAEAMTLDSGKSIPAFKVDGGAVNNDLLMQFQADILGTNVVRPKNVESTSLGAAFLAGLAVGVWKSPHDIRKAWKAQRVFKPKMSDAVRSQHLSQWRDAVRRA